MTGIWDVQAVLLDMDGTLLDTERVYFDSLVTALGAFGYTDDVETLCHVKHIIAMGGGEYARIGRPNNTGTRIVCVSGDVVRPGYFEIEVGAVTMGQLIHEMAGGPKPGRKIKAVIPGGSSAKVLRAGNTFKLKAEPVLTIMPPPCRNICAISYFMHNHTPFRFTASRRSKSASSVSAVNACRLLMPALLWAISKLPQRFTT